MRHAFSSVFGAAALIAAPSTAAAQRPAIGAPAPLPVVHDLAGSERPLKQLAGRRGLVILFWAGWSDRSIEELRRLDDEAPDMAAHGVTVAAVSVERFELDEAEKTRLRDRVQGLNLRVPVFVDRGLELFHAYGVVTIPSTAVIDANGRLSYFLFGYSHEQREELFDAIDAVAGIARKPTLTAAFKAAPAALRRVQLGRLQLSQGHEAPARSSFEEAVKADATFPDPLVELAALALDSNDFRAARALLDRAAALDAGHIGVQREGARLAALTGQIASAETALEALIAKGGDSTTAAYLGYLLQADGDNRRAMTAFDRAQEISGIDPRSYGATDSSPAGAAAKAMTAYRREVAPGRR
jgi:tetratricopeptide (TPR) repeat protein